MIFLVDDDPIQNLITTQLIKSAGLEDELKVYNNGKEVLDSLDKGYKPRIILLDINMPIMDGWEFLEHYSSDDCADVYMLTSSSNNYDLERASTFNCIKGYYTKPINIDTIKSIFKLKVETDY